MLRLCSLIFALVLTAAAHAADLRPLLAQGGVVIDVRTPQEFQQGHVDGAFNIPFDIIGGRIGNVAAKPDTPVILYCRSGRRSAIAENELRRLGYRNIVNAGSLDEARAALGR